MKYLLSFQQIFKFIPNEKRYVSKKLGSKELIKGKTHTLNVGKKGISWSKSHSNKPIVLK